MTWVTVEEFAELQRYAPSTVSAKCRKGEIPAEKHGVSWMIDIDLYKKISEQKMLERMSKAKSKDIPKLNQDSKEWIKEQKKKILERLRGV